MGQARGLYGAGPAYGIPLVLDPVYSGKGLAGLVALIRENRWSRDDHVVFVHTGGAPALFAYLDLLAL